MKLYIICGLPRTGKSTWTKKNSRNCIVVSPDSIRKEIFGHQFHSFANNYVFALAEAMVLLLLKQGKNVIVDATHLNEFTREKWLPIAKATNCKVFIVWTYAHIKPEENLKLALLRNKNSIKEEQLPEDAIKRMHNIFEAPNEDSSWYKVIHFYNKQKGSKQKISE